MRNADRRASPLPRLVASSPHTHAGTCTTYLFTHCTTLLAHSSYSVYHQTRPYARTTATSKEVGNGNAEAPPTNPLHSPPPLFTLSSLHACVTCTNQLSPLVFCFWLRAAALRTLLRAVVTEISPALIRAPAMPLSTAPIVSCKHAHPDCPGLPSPGAMMMAFRRLRTPQLLSVRIKACAIQLPAFALASTAGRVALVIFVRACSCMFTCKNVNLFTSSLSRVVLVARAETCPSNCNSRGTCKSMRQIARDWGTEIAAPYYDGIGTEYTNWDADSIRGCVCDPGWTGGACDEGTAACDSNTQRNNRTTSAAVSLRTT